MPRPILACPICGRQPDIDECGLPTKETGPLGWYANCYGQTPHEHNVGVNSDTKPLVEKAWNDEVGRLIRVKTATVTDSCGCVFCDLGLKPEPEFLAGTMVHWTIKDGIVPCTKK